MRLAIRIAEGPFIVRSDKAIPGFQALDPTVGCDFDPL
jgi:hypothetical protein